MEDFKRTSELINFSEFLAPLKNDIIKLSRLFQQETKEKWVRGVIYDLDGTILDTTDLHCRAWGEAAKNCGIVLTPDMLQLTSGLSAEDAANAMGVPANICGEFIEHKMLYALEHISEARIFEDFLEVLCELLGRKIPVGICTSGERDYVKAVLNAFPQLAPLKEKDRIIDRGLTWKGKPDPEPISLAVKALGLKSWSCAVVGDSVNDYLAALRAGCGFRYFCRDGKPDHKIPAPVRARKLEKHTDILNILRR